MKQASKPAIYLALLHHPILNRSGEVVATAVTNVDIHDLARSGRTYGVDGVYYVTPIEQQQKLLHDIIDHWTLGNGAERNAIRAEAFALARVAASWEMVAADIQRCTGRSPDVVVTSAQFGTEATTFSEYRAILRTADVAPQLLLFGTGWGLADEVVQKAIRRLASVRATEWSTGTRRPYNHLSVRSAVAIILDRLFGDGG